MSTSATIDSKRMPGRATAQGTLRYAARFQGRAAPGHFREIPGGLLFSSIGIGTYLGEPDEATDGGYPMPSSRRLRAASTWWIPRSTIASSAANALGAASGNFRKVSAATKSWCARRPDFSRQMAKCRRSQRIFFAGIPGARRFPPKKSRQDATAWRRAIWRINSTAACGIWASKCGRFLPPQSRNTIKRNSARGMKNRIREAFPFLEAAVSGEKIRAYGIATWNSFREDPRRRVFFARRDGKIARESCRERPSFSLRPTAIESGDAGSADPAESGGEGRAVAMVQAARR